ncbi:MAG: ankyrin repeat domain-containing protein [Halobacteriovoraceae bacterium]|nr:ankyrin repeat domain-containing protein [Halobacteriovoraceae bacterium]
MTNKSNLNLETLKKSAKNLKKALKASDDQASHQRFLSVFGSRKKPEDATHSDCLHILAIENDFKSWRDLLTTIEIQNQDQTARKSYLGKALLNGNNYSAQKLIGLYPDTAEGSIWLQIALLNKNEVRKLLDKKPELATTPQGTRYPIHYLTFTSFHQEEQSLKKAQLEILDLLVSHGADINQPLKGEDDHSLSPLYGAIGNYPNYELAKALLEKGANPNDNESLYHSTEYRDTSLTELLFQYGAKVGNTNAFYRQLDKESVEGVELFLEKGTHPNDPLFRHPSGSTTDERNALLHAIMRGRSAEIGRLLIGAGVDTAQTFEGASPYSLAVRYGNTSMKELLEELNLSHELSVKDQFFELAFSHGDLSSFLKKNPKIYEEMNEMEKQILTELAMNTENNNVVKACINAGFDPNKKGESGMIPLHSAGWWGNRDLVRFLLPLSDIKVLNDYGGDALGTILHGSQFCPGKENGHYLECVKEALKAGATIKAELGHLEMGAPEIIEYLESLTGPSKSD